MTFDGRVAVVAGASGKLGPVVAARLAEAGAKVALLGRSADALEQLAAELPGGPDRHAVVAVDLGDLAATTGAAATVRERLGPAAILVHAVGGYLGETGIAEAPEDELPAMLDAHVRSAYHAFRAFVPDIREAAGGRIVSFSTTTAQTPMATAAAYSAAKAGLEALTLSVARELAKTDATANVVVLRAIGDQKRTETSPDEIASFVLWLCSPEAAPMNGQRIPLLGRA